MSTRPPPISYNALGLNSLKPLCVLLAISLVRFAYVRALVPIYGSSATEYTLNKAIFATIAIAAITPTWSTAEKILSTSGLLLAAGPSTFYWVAVWTARWGNPVWGPTASHAMTIVPIVYTLATVAMSLKTPSIFGLRYANIPLTNFSLKILLCYWCATSVPTMLSQLPQLDHLTESDILVPVSGGVLAIWLAEFVATDRVAHKSHQNKARSSQSPTKYLLPPVFFVIWTYLFLKYTQAPAFHHALRQPYTHPTYPLQIHSSVQSTTGLIVVGEALPPDESGDHDGEMHSVRYLRASHSLLGGVWMGSKVMTLDGSPAVVDSHGTPLGDSIYSTFVLQEAVRLINSTERGRSNHIEHALIIGLGAGISATAFRRHSISTTIVEIDPAVYEAARAYFGLPDPGPDNVFLEDARHWVAKKRSRIEATFVAEIAHSEVLYDFVVHDCFSGGGVPEHIFTTEFWEDLKFALRPDGIAVVNFAGKLYSDASRAILRTLEKTFHQCRAFHDSMEATLSDEQYESDFVNMVLFCTSSPSPITFRRSRTSDYLNSPLRRHVLSSLPQREVDISGLRGDTDDSSLILTDQYNPLGAWQKAEAFHHWHVMREVLKDVFWETY